MSALEEFLIGEPESEGGDDAVRELEIPDNIEAADWQLRRLARLRRLMAENDALAAVEIERVRAWVAGENARLERQATFYEQALTAFHAQLLDGDPKRKTINLPAGSLKARKHPDSVVVLDAEQFVAWALDERPELVRTKVEPNKSEIKRLLSVGPLADDVDPGHVLVDPTSGVTAPGVVLTPGETSFTVDCDLRKEVGE